jgi:hypothetical protein
MKFMENIDGPSPSAAATGRGEGLKEPRSARSFRDPHALDWQPL